MIILQAALLGLVTTSSVMMGAALGLYLPAPKKLLGAILAFAAGSLIASLAIELAFEGAAELTRRGAQLQVAWFSIAGGFASGAVIYYLASLFLDEKGAALRYPSRFLEYARNRKRQEASRHLSYLSKCALLRNLPSTHLEPLLEHVANAR